MKTTTVTFRGVALLVEYSVSDMGDITLSEVWIKGIEMLCLMGDDVVSSIQDKIRRQEGL